MWFLIRRAFWALFLFFTATIITFVIFFVVPRDPGAIVSGGASGSSAFGHQVRLMWHLDSPLYRQYGLFVWNVIRHGSLGYSFQDGASVRWIIGQDAPVTASLVLGGAVFWLALAIPIGILSALRPRSLLDRSATILVLFGISAPAVWIGLILAYVFGFKLGWAPIADYCNFFPSHGSEICSGPARWAYHLLLPWVTFMLLFAALYVRMIRASLLETMNEEFVRTAVAKGASAWHVLVHHVLRNSMLPVVTILGMDLGLSLSSAAFTETVYNLHGLGADLVRAGRGGNLPVCVGIILCVTLAVIVFNFLVDVAYAWLDPRIRLTT